MPQSLTNVLVHLAFSTKDRTPHLTGEIRGQIFPYMGGLLHNME